MTYTVLILCYYPRFNDDYLTTSPKWMEMYENITTIGNRIPYNEWKITAIGVEDYPTLNRGNLERNSMYYAKNYMNQIGVNSFIWQQMTLNDFIHNNGRKKYDLIIDEFCPLAGDVKGDKTIYDKKSLELNNDMRKIIPSFLKNTKQRKGKFITFFWPVDFYIKKKTYSWFLWNLVRNKKLIVTNENYNWKKEGNTLKEYQISPEQKSEELSSSRQSPIYSKPNIFHFDKDKESKIEPAPIRASVSELNSKERKINKYLNKIKRIEDIMEKEKDIIGLKYIEKIRREKIRELKNKIQELVFEGEKLQPIVRPTMRKATLARPPSLDKSERSLSFTNKIRELKRKAKSKDIIKAQTAIYELINIENEMGQGFLKTKRKKAKSKKKKSKNKKIKREKAKSKKRKSKSKKRKSKKTKRKKKK